MPFERVNLSFIWILQNVDYVDILESLEKKSGTFFFDINRFCIDSVIL